MKLSLLASSLSLGLLLGAAAVTPSAIAAPTVGSSTTVSKMTYAVKPNEYKQIHAWIIRNSPAYAPLQPLGSVTVTRTVRAASSMLRPAGSDGPPVPLPSNGLEGEEITITNTTPDGGSETWAYTFTNGAWKLVEYHFVGPKETSNPPAS